MFEYAKRMLYPEETIQKFLPQITETFIEYYGEDKRQEIETKFKNIIITCTQSPNSLKNKLFSLKQEYSQSLIKNFFEKLGLDYNKENIKKIFGDSEPLLEHSNINPISKYLKLASKEEMSIYLRQSLLRDIAPFIHLFYPNIENIETFIENNDLSKINQVCEVYQNILNDYHSFINTLKPYKDYISECKEIKKDLNKKYTLQLIEKFEEYFSKEEIQTYKEKGYLSGKILLYLGYSLEIPSTIEAFSEESQKIVDDNKSPSWQVNSILNDRIKFFNDMGIYLGDEYQSYQKNSKCQSIIPTPTLTKQIRDIKEDLEMRMYNEYFTSIPAYQNNRKKIDDEKLYLKDDGYNASTFMYAGTYVTPNIKQIDGHYRTFSLVNINFDYVDEYIDKKIIHELNHVYELNLISVDQTGANYSCGWEKFHEPVNPNQELFPLQEDDSKRKYELFNEIINELIAQEITNKLHENGIYIFYEQDQAKIKGGTGYESTRFLVQSFYEEFKEEILASRHGNMKYLFDACGKENFDELNQLFHSFKDMGLGFKLIKLYEDLNNKIETEDTKKLQKIINKRDLILQNMLQYKKMSKKI